MIAALILCIAHAFASDDGLQRAIALVRSGDARAALTAAEAEPDELKRLQAEVYVRNQAGDLEGALLAAERGSRAHPADPWLAERCVSIALSLKRAHAAHVAIARLESAAQNEVEPERTRWLNALRAARTELDAIDQSVRDRNDADSRASIVALCASLACVAGLVFLARRA